MFSMHSCRLWHSGLLGGLILALTSSAAAEDHHASQAVDPRAAAIEVEVANDLLTLHADGVPLAEVLRAIGQAGAFRVVLKGTFARPVHEEFADRPLEDALRHLVEGHALVILHEDRDRAPDVAAVAEIRVIENPARVAAENEGSEEPSQESDRAVPADAADDPPMDREAYRLARLGVSPSTRDDIQFELSDPDPVARLAAVPKVGSLRPYEAIEVISDIFENDTDATVRSRAVAALTRVENSSAVRLLRERAVHDEDAALRAQALNALTTSAGIRTVTTLGRALRLDTEPEVRLTAIRALQRVGGDWARHYLQRAATDLDPGVSEAARQALTTWPANFD